MNMRKIGLCSISTNHRAKEHIARASAIIESIGIECFSFFLDERCDESADIVVALGGDGTILRSKKYAKQHGVPVLGVNIGRIGFLSECGIEELGQAINKIQNDAHTVEHNMMLTCTMHDGTKTECTNDFIIYKSRLGSIANFEIMIGGSSYGTVFGDGLVVCTPLGSTGYSLSAGGSIISTSVSAIGVTPICSHSLGARHLIAPAQTDIPIIVNMLSEGILSNDGCEEFKLHIGDSLVITPSNSCFDLIRFKSRNLYNIVRSKLI